MTLRIMVYDLTRQHQEWLIDAIFEKEVNCYFKEETLIIEKIGTLDEFIDIINYLNNIENYEIYIMRQKEGV